MYLLPVLLVVVLILTIVILIKLKPKSFNEELERIENLFTNGNEQVEKTIKDEISRNREEIGRNAKDQREELNNSFKLFSDQISNRLNDIADKQKLQLDVFSKRLEKLVETNEQKFEKLENKIEIRLKEIEKNNAQKLEEMRATVDEKLHETLEKRLGKSFEVVNAQLKSVYEGLGEMQKLATGVGELKRVLTNVKTRGTWGEVQLEALIDQVLTPDQYSKNVATKSGSQARVEFAIKLPGRDDDADEVVWLPIDAKFPLEDYQRLQEAQDAGDIALVDGAAKLIERRIKEEAKSISGKYLDPPNTTDFAFMFLPIEGLYAEVLRIPGLFDFIQREYKVTVTGPTTFSALLNSLQMGFRTLAISKRSSEVWKLLGSVKTEFQKFGDVLDKTQTKLEQASKTIGDAKVRTRAIERHLRDVQELPEGDQPKLIDDSLE
ncbi:MAG: DNA recombination protein RmuC [Ignavibacteriae bacterium]|nr:DNA recombination protein RmuC [Ignavibacteriota bacterium]NOG97304.1 DNA recombination protein RmuC [Ignavibacteriota bacterium]